jgi:hypothetical protein
MSATPPPTGLAVSGLLVVSCYFFLICLIRCGQSGSRIATIETVGSCVPRFLLDAICTSQTPLKFASNANTFGSFANDTF